MSTIFKQIIDKEIPAKIVFEDDQCLAFEDISPQAPVHILVIPKKEITSLDKLEPEDQELMGHLLLCCQKIARERGVSDQGYRLVTNIGPHGGQSVHHLHFHILGGKPLNMGLG